MIDPAIASLIEIRDRIMTSFEPTRFDIFRGQIKPIKGIPPGVRYKVRLRPNACPGIIIKTPTAICACILVNQEDHWIPLLQNSMNIRGASSVPLCVSSEPSV